jgi:cytochrome c-type biogenesis protein CcmH/NrfG
MTNRRQLEEQLVQARADREDIELQLDAGELSEADAAELAAQYEAEAARLNDLLTLDPEPASDAPAGPSARVWWLTAATVVALAAIGYFVTQSITDRPEGGFATGNIETGRDLESVSNEEMEATVAQFPDIVDMRAALALRYFEAGDFSAASGHYLEILDRDPDHPEALANLGWITFVSDGGPEADAAAENLLNRSLQALPGNPDALFFLANLKLEKGNGVEARVLLEDLLATGAISDEDRSLIDELLAEADRRSSQ